MLEIVAEEQVNASSLSHGGGKQEEQEKVFEEVGDESARVMEWMKECEEPVLSNLLDDVVKIEGPPTIPGTCSD